MSQQSGAYLYEVFGLRLEADRPIEGLVTAACVEQVDVRVRCSAWPLKHSVDVSGAPFYRSPILDPSGEPFLSTWKIGDAAHLRLEISDGTAFIMNRDGTDIWVEAPSAGSELVSEYLLGPILGLVLRRRGVVCLHASAIVFNDVAVAFAGPEGTGKSTIATLFAMRGHTVITDDLAALAECGDGILVQPGAPYLRSRPGAIESAAILMGREAHLEQTADGYLDLALRAPGYAAAAAPVRLGAVYCLDWSEEALGGKPRIEPITGADALLSLAADTWATRLMEPAERATELDVLARLVQSVPLRRVSPTKSHDLADLVDLITADVRQVLTLMPVASGASDA